MKILVTGSKGFIGSELVKSLDRYDLITADIKDGIDLTDRDFWNNLEKVDIIFHLSAIVGVCNFTSTNAEKSYINNRIINNNVIEYAKKHNPYVLFASSSEVYGECDNLDENADFKILNSPRGLYSLDKILMEQELKINKIRHSSCRLFNIVGKNQDIKKGVLPKLSYEIKNKIKSKLSKYYRTFTSVHDCVNIMKKLGISEIEGDFNISSDETFSIENVYLMLCAHFNKMPNYSIIEKSDIKYKKPNNEKIKVIYSKFEKMESIINEF